MSRDQKPVGVLYFKGSRAQPRGILYYLSYAAGLHGLFFGLTAMVRSVPPEARLRSATVVTMEEPVAVVEPPPPEVKPVVAEPVAVVAREPRVPSASSPNQRAARASLVTKFPPTSEPAGEEHGIDKEFDSLGVNAINALQPERRITRAGDPLGKPVAPPLGGAPRPRGGPGASNGPNAGANGPTGVGAVWGKRSGGPPHLSGRNVWGGAGKQALKGTLCFISPGTRSLVAVERCVAAGTFYTNVLNIPKSPFTQGFPGISDRFEWFAINYTGKFTVRDAGKYMFRVASDDGSMVWVDDGLLLNNDGLHPVRSRANAIFLSEGGHTLRLFYYQGPRVDVALQLFVTPPGSSERLWGPEL